jgi:hypothetical protein
MNHLTGTPYGLGSTGAAGAAGSAGPTGPQGAAGFTNPLTGDLLAGGFKVSGLADPEAGQDAVTLDYYESNLPSSGGSVLAKLRFSSSADYLVIPASGIGTGLWQDAYIRIGWDASNTPEFRAMTLPQSGGIIVHSRRYGSDKKFTATQLNYTYDMQNTYNGETTHFTIFAPDDNAYPNYKGFIFLCAGTEGNSQLVVESY